MKQIHKQTCIDCQFLSQSHSYNPQTGKHRHDVLPREHRQTLREGGSLYGGLYLACDWGEWDENDSDGTLDRKVELAKDRRSLCFFWKYQPAVTLQAAKIKQQRAEDREKMLDSRRLAILAIFVAAIGLFCNLVQLVIRVIEFGSSILGVGPTATPHP